MIQNSENLIITDPIGNRFEEFAEQAKNAGYKVKMLNVSEEELKKCWTKINSDHKYRSNNWLKLHGKPKRRKPFKKSYIMMDEGYLFFNSDSMGKLINSFRVK